MLSLRCEGFKVTHRKAATVMLMLCAAWANATASHAAAPRESKAAQTPAAKQGTALRTKGRRSVVVRRRGHSYVLDLSKHVDAMRIEDATELSRTRRGGFVYVVLEVCGLSKVPPDDRQCGAGIECNLVWLKLDPRWKVSDAKSVLYESCWLPVTSDEGPKVNGRTLLLEFDDLRDDTRHEVSYDAEEPEEGLTEKTRPMPKENP